MNDPSQLAQIQRELSAAISERDAARVEYNAARTVQQLLTERCAKTELERDEYAELASKQATDGILDVHAICDQRDAAIRDRDEFHERMRKLEIQLASARETLDTILSVLAGEEVDTSGNEAAQAVRALMLKGVQK